MPSKLRGTNFATLLHHLQQQVARVPYAPEHLFDHGHVESDVNRADPVSRRLVSVQRLLVKGRPHAVGLLPVCESLPGRHQMNVLHDLAELGTRLHELARHLLGLPI